MSAKNKPNHTFSPGSYGCHEALHMASYLATQVSNELCDHPSVLLNPKWHKLADKAADALAELYSAIGSGHFAAVLEDK